MFSLKRFPPAEPSSQQSEFYENENEERNFLTSHFFRASLRDSKCSYQFSEKT
jgi:hypothetical protein